VIISTPLAVQYLRRVSIGLLPLAILAWTLLAMATEDPDVNPWEELGLLSDEGTGTPLEGPRCAQCCQVRLHEWINWQKCWSNPGTGADGDTWILVYPIVRVFQPYESQPIMLRLHSQGSAGDIDFWWFFICNRCRFQFRMRGLITECYEIEDRFCTGQYVRPTLVPQNVVRNRDIDGPLGVSEYWSRSTSPETESSGNSDPWMGPYPVVPNDLLNIPN